MTLASIYIHLLGDLATSVDLYEDKMFSKVDIVRNRSLLNRLTFRKTAQDVIRHVAGKCVCCIKQSYCK